MQSDLINPENDSLRRTVYETIHTDVIAIITSSPTKITPAALIKILSNNYRIGKKHIKIVLRDLVAAGDLIYTYEYGRTVLERSFHQAVCVSKHVVLKPPGSQYRLKPKDVVVEIKAGASFGTGQHPSTRLAIKGIEYVFLESPNTAKSQNSSVLDVGTGSGVLVITAVRFGIFQGFGIDVDPCARVEARENVKINGFEDRIEISDRSLASIDRQFWMVTANLRFPSLRRWCRNLAYLTAPRGFLVLSGIRINEREDLLDTYASQNCHCLWQAEELDWVGVVLQRRV